MFAKQLQINDAVYACDIRLEAEEAYNPSLCYKEDVIMTTFGMDRDHAVILYSWMKKFHFALYDVNIDRYPEFRFVFRRYAPKEDVDIAYAAMHNYEWVPTRYDPTLWKR